MSSGEWYLIDIIARLLSWPPCARSGAVRRWQLTPIMPLEGRGRGGSVGHRVRAAARYAAGSLHLLCPSQANATFVGNIIYNALKSRLEPRVTAKNP